jgi:uncharacterized protein (TIGR03067 family)
MTSIFLIAGTMWGIAAPAPKEPPKKEPPLPVITGIWETQKAVVAGMEVPIPPMAFEFTADGQLNIRDPKRADVKQNMYKVDSTKSPAELDWALRGKAEQTLRGIYKIDGNTLTLCFEDGFDGKRPDKFESLAGTKKMLWTLKRVEKKKE